MSRNKLALLALLVAMIGIAFALDLHQIITLENFRARQADIDAWIAGNRGIAALTFFAIYVAITAVSIPGAAALTLIAGALFGLLQGTIIVSFASTTGAWSLPSAISFGSGPERKTLTTSRVNE